MKIIVVDGFLGKDCEILKSKFDGKQYAKFSIGNKTFIGGKEKTEWFDITYKEPLESKCKLLKKGQYVIVTGVLTSEVNIDKSNKVWLNQHVTAQGPQSVEIPSRGSQNKDTDQTVSTYTGSTPSIVAEDKKIAPKAEEKPAEPAYVAVTPTMTPMDEFNDGADGDLPF